MPRRLHAGQPCRPLRELSPQIWKAPVRGCERHASRCRCRDRSRGWPGSLWRRPSRPEIPTPPNSAWRGQLSIGPTYAQSTVGLKRRIGRQPIVVVDVERGRREFAAQCAAERRNSGPRSAENVELSGHASDLAPGPSAHNAGRWPVTASRPRALPEDNAFLSARLRTPKPFEVRQSFSVLVAKRRAGRRHGGDPVESETPEVIRQFAPGRQ